MHDPRTAEKGWGMTRFLCLTAWIFCCGISGCASLKDMSLVSGGADYWRADLDGEIQFTEAQITGTRIDVVDTLDLDRRDETVAYRGSISLGNVILEGRYLELRYRGDTTLNQEINFLGQTFNINQRVLSEVDGKFAFAKSKIGLFGTPEAPWVPGFALGTIFGINYFDLGAAIEAPPSMINPTTLRESDSTEVIFPVFGLVGSVNLPLGDTFAIFGTAEVSGLNVDYADIEGEYIEASGEVGVRIAQVLSGGVGYRYMDLDFEEDDNEADVTFDGLYIFGEITF